MGVRACEIGFGHHSMPCCDYMGGNTLTTPTLPTRGGVSPGRGNASKTQASLPRATVTRISRLLSTMLAVYELQAQQGRDTHLAFDGEITD